MIARAVDDPEFSNRILSACRAQLINCRRRGRQ
jgi:hypothetical protein